MEGDEGVILLFQKALMNIVSQTFDLRGSGGSAKQMTKFVFPITVVLIFLGCEHLE